MALVVAGFPPTGSGEWVEWVVGVVLGLAMVTGLLLIGEAWRNRRRRGRHRGQ